MILIMKEMENMIEENIISSPHMISLWYDWKDKKVEEIETLDDIKLLISKYDVNKKKLSFSETVKEMFKSLYFIEEKFRVCYLTKNIVSIKSKEEKKYLYEKNCSTRKESCDTRKIDNEEKNDIGKLKK